VRDDIDLKNFKRRLKLQEHMDEVRCSMSSAVTIRPGSGQMVQSVPWCPERAPRHTLGGRPFL